MGSYSFTELDSATGVVTEIVIDSDTNTYTVSVDGEVTEQRPLTDDEMARATAQDVVQTEQANEQSLHQGIADNIAALEQVVANLNALTNTPNATINANPASYIKDLAREAKTIARQTIRIAKVMVGDLDDATVPE